MPVVIADGLTYLEAMHYAPPQVRDRLSNVAGEDQATHLVGTATIDKNNRLLARITPLRVEGLATFQTGERRFILYSGGKGDWLTRYLLAGNYRLRLLSPGPDGLFYLVEH